LRFFYCSNSDKVNEISQNGINADDNGSITVIMLDERFLMYQFVVDSYAYEILGIKEYCFFEIDQRGVKGKIDQLKTDDIFAPFYKTVKQDYIEKEYLIPQITDRYESMGLDIGVFLVENKHNFNDKYKKKILEYAKESL
jgi:hypothetical protein